MEIFNKKDIGERLAELRKSKGLNQKDFAQKLDTSQGYISEVESGEKALGAELLAALIDEFKVDSNWLLSGKKSPIEVTIIKAGKVHYVPLDEFEKDKSNVAIEIPLAADVPASSKMKEINFHDYPEYFGVKIDPKNHFAIKVHEEYGYSMSPAISPGDFIICNSNPKIIKDGDLVLVQYDSTMGAIKKYHRNKELKAVTLYSTNTAEPPITLHENKIKQMFKVTHIIKI